MWQLFIEQTTRSQYVPHRERVESDDVGNENFNVKEQMEKSLDGGSKIFACETCRELRQKEGFTFCQFSTLKDLTNIAEESDRIVSF